MNVLRVTLVISKTRYGQDSHNLEVILVESLSQFMQCLRRGKEKSPRVRLVIVRGDECSAPGAESTIGIEFYTANSEALVETIVDKTRYSGAPIIIGGAMAHQVELDLSRSVLIVSTIYEVELTGRRPSSATLHSVSIC